MPAGEPNMRGFSTLYNLELFKSQLIILIL